MTGYNAYPTHLVLPFIASLCDGSEAVQLVLNLLQQMND